MAITTGFNPYSMVAKSSQQVAFRGEFEPHKIQKAIDNITNNKQEVTLQEARSLIVDKKSVNAALTLLNQDRLFQELEYLTNSSTPTNNVAKNQILIKSLGNLMIAIGEQINK